MIGHWIDGKLTHTAANRSIGVYDPATGRQRDEVSLAGADEVGRAVAAAKAAWPGWAATSLGARTQVLFAFRELLRQHADELAGLISGEHGKMRDDAAGEVTRGLEVVEFACGIPHLLKGEYSENVSTNVDTYSLRQPLGVVAGVTPFNFPAMVPLWMFPIALACGNTFVLKPSERDPSPSLLLAELLDEAGLPPGAFNVVQGDREAVEAILDHPDVAAVSFVGSTPVARSIYARASAAGKRVQALGGAKNHLVVLPDADLDRAADAAVSSAYGSAGERCMAVSALVAVGDVGDRLVEAITERVANLRVGPATDPANDMGPLITSEHRDRVRNYLHVGAEEGATVAIDGRDHDVPDGDGFWLGPSLLDHVTPGMEVYRDEIFGPVLCQLRVAALPDAIRVVNDNPYGNGVAIFTRSGAAARAFGSEVTVGMVGVNVPIPVPMAFHSFGGWKSSLFGDTHVYGPEGVRFYSRGKVVTSRWEPLEGMRLDFPAGD